MTQDADLVIDADEAAVVQLARAVEPAFYVSEDVAREAVRLRRMFNVIHLDTGFKIDLVIKKSRAFSAEELRRREPGVLAGRQVDFATAEDTILTKLEWAKLGDSERQCCRNHISPNARGSIGPTSSAGPKLLDEYLLRLGMRPSAFVVMALDEWAGLAPEAPR